MIDIILYPAETVYGLGVNAFNKEALRLLCCLKGRDAQKLVSWLVRDAADIAKYSEISPLAAKLIERWLPGPLTLILPLKNKYKHFSPEKGTAGFRISTDNVAKNLVADFMGEYSAPLTCTSANLSGLPTLSTVPEILNQLGVKQSMVTKVYDDGSRSGSCSTVIEVLDDQVKCLRSGAYCWDDIQASLL